MGGAPGSTHWRRLRAQLAKEKRHSQKVRTAVNQALAGEVERGVSRGISREKAQREARAQLSCPEETMF
jgi:hypothetical protein